MEKQVVFFDFCRFIGLMKLGRWLMRRSGPHLIILNYHRASGGDLRRHLLYLKRHYRMMHLEEALEELYLPHNPKKQVRDRRTPLVLTFDDGYNDNYTHGFALAQELQVPITIFLIPGYIEQEICFWWLAGERLVHHAKVNDVEIEGHTYHLNQKDDQKALVDAIYTRVCNASSVAERESFLEMVREALAAPSTAFLEGESVLNWAEIHAMDKSGRVSFGAHTMHHPVLAYLSDPNEVKYEVSTCRAPLEQELGHEIYTFAYPLGRPEHIGKVAPEAVQKAGYKWAVTTVYGINTPQTAPYQLRRIAGDVKRHWLLLAADVSGLGLFFYPLFPYGRTFLSKIKGVLTLMKKTTSFLKLIPQQAYPRK